MHNGRIDMGGEKMSKSTGNLIWANDLLDRISYQVFRLIILNVPYRQPLNYKEELIAQATNDFEKIRRAYVSLYRDLELNYEIKKVEIKASDLVNIKNEFIEAMSNDFNTANAITSIFNLVKLINNYIRNKETSYEVKEEALELLKELLWVLGIEVEVSPLTKEEKELVIKWVDARGNKDFELADSLRKEITERNIVL